MSTNAPPLYARNETNKTVTFNNRYLNWELPPYPNPDYISPLPWDVAIANGFDRLWDGGQITVALDRSFAYPLAELPRNGGTYLPFVHLQSVAQATTVITHNFGRPGPVGAVVTSPDGTVEYFNVDVQPLDFNSCRISLDDPVPFLATIF